MGSLEFILSVALPVILFGVIAYFAPRIFLPDGTRSHADLAGIVFLTALALLVGGALLMALLYALEGRPFDAASRELGVSVRYFFTRSAMAALVWGPVLALSWFGLAQRVEQLKSQDGMRVDPK